MSWTRREFLNTSLAGATLYSIAPAIGAASSLNDAERGTLKAAIDEIIPAGDGMPAASDIGGVAYIEKLIDTEPGMGRVLREVVARLNADDFAHQPQSQRLRVLQQLEQSDKASFALFRDSVYESYYTNPRIWKLIGYELYPTDHAGPHMKPFDESVVAVVSKKPRYYREA